jgi:hypothetical protein
LRGDLIRKKDEHSNELKITDRTVEFRCDICGKLVICPSPESATQNPNIFSPTSVFVQCVKCNKMVCRRCIGDRKGRLCRDCKD